MKIKSISLKNFKRFGDYDTTVDFSDDTALMVMGDNGAGKTSIFVAALLFCLYGETQGKIDAVVNRKTKKDCKVEINFVVDNDDYCIIRYRKHTEHGNKIVIFKNGKNISPLRSDESQVLINEIIGVTFNSMKSSVVFSPDTYKALLKETLSERLKVFEGILSLKVVNVWADNIKKEKDSNFKKISDTKSKLERANGIVQNLEESNKSYLKKCNDKIEEINRELRSIDVSKKTIEKEIEEFGGIDVDKEISNLESYKKIVENNSLFKDNVRLLESRISEYNLKLKNLGIFKSNLSEKQEINVNKEKEKLLESRRIKSRNLEKKQAVDLLLSKLVNVSNKEKNLASLLKSREKIIAEINSMEGSVCYACGQPTSDEIHSKLKAEKNSEKNNIDSDIEKISSSLEEDKNNNSKIQTEILEINSSLETETQCMDESSIIRIEEEIKNLIINIDTLSKSIEASSSQNSEDVSKLQEIKMKVVDEPSPPKYNEVFLESLKQVINSKKESLVFFDSRILVLKESLKNVIDQSFIDENVNKINALKKSIEKVNKELSKLEVEDLHFDVLLKLFSNKDGGIKKILIEKMIKTFNEKIVEYMPIFFDEKIEVYFDKDLKDKILLDDVEVDFADFSSGEKKRFEVCISFALFSVVKEFFSSSVSFMVFDEVMDNYLDKRGVEAVKSIINDLAENNTVVVISHKDDFKDSFENRITLYKDAKGYSRISTDD